MSKYFRTRNFEDVLIPQVDDLEKELNAEVGYDNAVDEENLKDTTKFQDSQLVTASFEARRLNVDCYFAEQSADVVLSSSYQDLTGSSLSIPITVASTVMILAGWVTPKINSTRTWTGKLLINGSDSEMVQYANGSTKERVTYNVWQFSNQSVGTCTLGLQAKISSGTPSQVNSWIFAMVYSQ